MARGSSHCRARRRAGRRRRSRRARGAVGLGRHRQDPGADRARAAAAAERRRARDHPVPDLHQGRRGRNGQPHRRAARGLGADEATATCASDLFALGEADGPPMRAARAAPVRQGARCARRPAHPDHPQLRPGAARGLSGRSGDHARLPADRGPGRAGAGADDARQSAGRGRSGGQ